MRIFPEMTQWMTWPVSSFTRVVALGRFSTTSPCISITSSLAMSAHGHSTLEIGLAQQAFVLVGHHVGLDLRHEVHRDDHDDEERRAAEVEGHVPAKDEELGQQADQ